MERKEKEYSPEVKELVRQANELAEKMRAKFTREEIVEQFKEFLDTGNSEEYDKIQQEMK